MTLSQNDVIARLRQLPSLPLIVQEVIASFNDADLDTTTLAHKIAHDQGLSAKVLRVANSTFYGLPRKVGSVQDAVMVLGFDTVRSLVLSAGMVQAFPSSPGSLFDRQAYWQRCFRVAALSKALAKELRQGQQLAFTAGMFYDIGQLVLDLCIPQQFAELLQQQKTSGSGLAELERAELGFNHADVGAELIRLWNFPPEIERVARYWQQPECQTNYDPLVCVVHTAALLESGLNGDELMTRLSQTWCGRMQMTWARIEACLPSPDQLEAAASLT
ncbi:MAG: HDOD domain-containing protein [Thermoleophilia bacterium]